MLENDRQVKYTKYFLITAARGRLLLTPAETQEARISTILKMLGEN